MEKNKRDLNEENRTARAEDVEYSEALADEDDREAQGRAEKADERAR
ncbi:MAG TPA: YfhD family protein [Bacillales bacterium]|nr:YfhD family protein [Bacillales bacterium]